MTRGDLFVTTSFMKTKQKLPADLLDIRKNVCYIIQQDTGPDL